MTTEGIPPEDVAGLLHKDLTHLPTEYRQFLPTEAFDSFAIELQENEEQFLRSETIAEEALLVAKAHGVRYTEDHILATLPNFSYAATAMRFVGKPDEDYIHIKFSASNENEPSAIHVGRSGVVSGDIAQLKKAAQQAYFNAEGTTQEEKLLIGRLHRALNYGDLDPSETPDDLLWLLWSAQEPYKGNALHAEGASFATQDKHGNSLFIDVKDSKKSTAVGDFAEIKPEALRIHYGTYNEYEYALTSNRVDAVQEEVLPVNGRQPPKSKEELYQETLDALAEIRSYLTSGEKLVASEIASEQLNYLMTTFEQSGANARRGFERVATVDLTDYFDFENEQPASITIHDQQLIEGATDFKIMCCSGDTVIFDLEINRNGHIQSGGCGSSDNGRIMEFLDMARNADDTAITELANTLEDWYMSPDEHKDPLTESTRDVFETADSHTFLFEEVSHKTRDGKQLTTKVRVPSQPGQDLVESLIAVGLPYKVIHFQDPFGGAFALTTELTESIHPNEAFEIHSFTKEDHLFARAEAHFALQTITDATRWEHTVTDARMSVITDAFIAVTDDALARRGAFTDIAITDITNG